MLFSRALTPIGWEFFRKSIQIILRNLRINHMRTWTLFYRHSQMLDANISTVHCRIYSAETSLISTPSAIRLNINVSIGFASLWLLYSRQQVMSLVLLLKPSVKYQWENHHEITLREQYKSLFTVQRNLKNAERRETKSKKCHHSSKWTKLCTTRTAGDNLNSIGGRWLATSLQKN